MIFKVFKGFYQVLIDFLHFILVFIITVLYLLLFIIINCTMDLFYNVFTMDLQDENLLDPRTKVFQ